MAFSQTDYPNSDACLMGDPGLRVYADQVVKRNYGPDDTFLRKYHEAKVRKLIPLYFAPRPTSDFISKEQVACSMGKIPFISGTKKICSTSNQTGYFTQRTPCITEELTNYIHWGLNETLKCFGSLLDKEDRKIIFKKITHESAFGFFFQYPGGTGVMQLVGPSKKEMFSENNSGYKFLKKHVDAHPDPCSSFTEILKNTPTDQTLPTCEFISVGDGIGRSFLAGVGLYLHYRSDPSNPYSAERLLNYWGVKKSNSTIYKKMRNAITLAMYNRGPGDVIAEIKNTFSPSELSRTSERKSSDLVTRILRVSSFNNYIQSVETADNNLCKTLAKN